MLRDSLQCLERIILKLPGDFPEAITVLNAACIYHCPLLLHARYLTAYTESLPNATIKPRWCNLAPPHHLFSREIPNYIWEPQGYRFQYPEAKCLPRG